MNQQPASQYSNTYVTNDLSLVCTLLCFNFTLLALDTSDQRKVAFVFQESDALQKSVKQYWDNQLAVNPKEFFNTLKDLKSRIYNQKYA